nr:YicC family protein [Chitinispirillaceae bacterium]
GDDNGTKLSWDREAVDNYVRIFKEIKTQYDLDGDITLSQLFSFSNIVKTGSVSFSEEVLWSHLRPLLLDAVAAFKKTREKEAAFLVKELRTTLKNIDRTLKLIEKLVPERKQDYVRNLQERIRKICTTEPDQSRIATEIALMADRLDISEECTRLRAHIAKFSEDFSSDEPVGKRMGFLLQEMNRESNTIGSKANDTRIAHLSVTLKEEIEKIREQIQNIE